METIEQRLSDAWDMDDLLEEFDINKEAVIQLLIEAGWLDPKGFEVFEDE